MSGFCHQIRPRYGEVDQQGVVFNAHWLTYFDDASTRFFEHLGFDPKATFAAGGLIDMMVVHAVLDWKGSVGFDDPVSITVTPMRLGTASFDLRYTATVAGRPACEGLITYVAIEHGTKQSKPIPAVLRDKLTPLMG